jgi:pimeloyl-ACP methyl ester carboxylesterase
MCRPGLETMFMLADTARDAFLEDYPRRSVAAAEGATFTCSHTVLNPEKPTILIALPFGVPVGVARAAFEKFESAFNVVTWQSRYILDLNQMFSGTEKLGPDEHVADMVRVLGALQIDRCYLVGYCSGAGISLLAAKKHPEIFTKLILVNGEYQLFRKGHKATDYQRSIDTFLPEVAKGREQACLIFSAMSDITKASKGEARSESDRQINLPVSKEEDLYRYPFSKEEYLYRYAKTYMAYRDFDALSIAARIGQNTLVLTGRRDVHSSIENSEAVDASLPKSTSFVDDQGDHYEFCRAGSRVLQEIGAFLNAHTGTDSIEGTCHG